MCKYASKKWDFRMPSKYPTILTDFSPTLGGHFFPLHTLDSHIYHLNLPDTVYSVLYMGVYI